MRATSHAAATDVPRPHRPRRPPENLGNRHHARPGGKQRHHPARRPSLSGVQAEGIDISGRNVDVPPGLHGKTARNFREHVIAHARPAPQALRRSPDLRRVLLSRRLHISRLRTSPPFQMTHAGFHRNTPQIRPEPQKPATPKLRRPERGLLTSAQRIPPRLVR